MKQGHSEHSEKDAGRGNSDQTSHHQKMVEDFRRRFWVSVALTVPLLALSPMLQGWVGVRETLAFPGAGAARFALASVVFFYGGWPFLKGFVKELAEGRPGMMTLIALAVAVA